MKTLIIIISIFCLYSIGTTQVISDSIIYKDGEVVFKGYLAYDKLLKSKRGGVIILHDQYGLNQFIKERTNELAKLGYIAFAVDIFGQNDTDDEKDLSEIIENLYSADNSEMLLKRSILGLENLSQHSKVDPNRIAAIGYGYGGTLALELARGGANLTASINFFGKLNTRNTNLINTIKCPILILVGSSDPYTTDIELESFEKEMSTAGNDWQINIYGDAVYGFTYYELGFEVEKGKAYNYNADKRSWEAVKILLQEVLK